MKTAPVDKVINMINIIWGCFGRPIYIYAFIGMYGVIAIICVTRYNDWGGDYSLYLSQARAIVQGDIKEFRDEVEFRVEKGAYEGPPYAPWGFPLFVSPAYALSDGNHEFIKYYLIICLMISASVLYAVMTIYGGRVHAGVAIVLFLSSGYIFGLTNLILSDFVGLLFASIVLILFLKCINTSHRTNETIYALMLGVVATFSVIIRPQNYVLIVAIVLWMVIRSVRCDVNRRRYARITLVSSVVFICSLWTYDQLDPMKINASYMTYFSFGDFIENAIRNVPLYIKGYRVYFTADDWSVWRKVIAVPMTFAMIVGMIAGIKRYLLLALYIVLLYAVLFVYPYYQHLRLVLPVLPFMSLFTVLGARRLGDYINCHSKRANDYHWIHRSVIMLAITLMLAGNALSALDREEVSKSYGPYSASSQEVFDIIRRVVPGDDAVSFFKPRILTYETKRKSVFIAKVSKAIEAGVRWGLFYQGQLKYNVPMFHEVNKGNEVFRNDKYVLYKFY